MKDCAHESFEARVDVQRLGDDDGRIRNYLAEVSIRCTQCGQSFHFLCPDAGLSFTKPTVDVGATTLHTPIAPGEAPLPERIRFDLQGVEH